MLALSSTLTTSPVSAKFSTPRIRSSSRSVSSKAFAGPNRNLNLGVNFNFLTGNVLRVSSLRIVRAPTAWRAAAAPRALAAPTNIGMKSLHFTVALPLVLGMADSLFNRPDSQWYFDLKKPRWQPPGFLFGGAWSVLYPLMGLASWLVWAEGGFAKQALPLSLYAVQLALNLAWPALFFGAKRLRAALYDIVLLNVAIVATIAAFKPVNAVAANLLKPYLAWVLFATALNYKLWDLNKLSSEGDAALPPLQPDT
jgi:benzodiazapine receptor